MSRRLLAANLAATVAVGLVAGAGITQAAADPASSTDTFVRQWNAVGTQALSAAAATPPDGHIILAYASIAVYDAVTSIEGEYQPFLIHADPSAGASPEAAVVAAAHRVLAHYLPAQVATILNPAYTVSLSGIDDGPAKEAGVALGEDVADAVIAERADDGFRVAVPYVAPNPPIAGVWLPTAQTPPIGTYAPAMQPFALPSADVFRPNGPPALGSKGWERDYNEVKAVGSRTANASVRTDDQTLAARFWGEAPVPQAHGALRGLIVERELDIFDAARLMAMVSVTYADGLIACLDAKYHYAFWRPITAINAGDTDGNSATDGDAAWVQLLPGTPNHPEYPSAHSCITPASGVVIARFLGTAQIGFTVPSLTGLGDRYYATPKALEDEVANARVWGGIHFRSAVDDGSKMAKQTANYILARHFKPVD